LTRCSPLGHATVAVADDVTVPVPRPDADAVLVKRPHDAAVVTDVETVTVRELPLAIVPNEHDNAPAARVQEPAPDPPPMLHDVPGTLGSVSFSVTPSASTEPTLETVIVYETEPPTWTVGGVAVFEIAIAGDPPPAHPVTVVVSVFEGPIDASFGSLV
jgi:hypothetical protein